MTRWSRWIGLVAAFLLVPVRVHQQALFRTITIDTSEVTTPALALTPDGGSIIFSALGHLFELPADGGKATQLTFGPSYDFDPAMSPDGSRLAFASNRDGTDAIYVAALDGPARRVAFGESWRYSRPHWSADGSTV